MLSVINNAKIMVDTRDDSLHIKIGDKCIPIGAGSGSGGPQMVEKVLLDEPEAVFHDDYGTMVANFEFVPAFKVGQTYDVEIDGNKFSCVAASMSMGDGTLTYIGNASLIPAEESYDDTGEPFVAASFGSVMSVAVAIPATYDDKPTLTFSIKITTMEEKASGGGMMRINVSASVDEYDNDVYSADKTYQEILDAIVAGILPYCVLGQHVLMLSKSDQISEIGTYGAMPQHHFVSINHINFNPQILTISIDSSEYVQFKIGNLGFAAEG